MIGLLLSVVVMAADTIHFAVCPTLPPTSDTTTRTIYGLVSDPFTGLPLPAGFSGIVTEAVRAKMQIPRDLPIAVLDERGQPTVVATAAFSVMANGTTRNVAVMSSSSSMRIDSLLTDAIDAASRDSSYPPLPPRAGNGIRLALELSPDSAAGAVPMFTIHVPTWHDFSRAAMPQSKLHPRVSTPMRGESDTLIVDLIVDQKGAPLLGTVHVMRSPGTLLTRTYLDWLKTDQFVPGHIQKCAVRSLVHLKGTMTIQDGF